ncbi:hypothetical protein [Streptomyces collinus]|uniref:hypothetical protein n=1 Tax=Streptomyces collinus TaxID=42684 RepID=UPI0033267460
MPESVPVRCPVCRRAHVCTAPSYPCACGAPTAVRLDGAAGPAVLAHRAWDEEWVTVRCAACGRGNQWPHPELGCPCGTVLRLAVSDPPPAALPSPGPTAPAPTPSPAPAPAPKPTHPPAPVPAPPPPPPPPPAATPAPARRGPFRPVTIRTPRDVVTATALYLRQLGYRGIRRADQRPPSGVGLAAHGLVAQVDPSMRPAAPRDVECLWLTAMTESACCAYFSLAGYDEDARACADTLGVPLFVLDLTGTPAPVNGPGRALAETGAA